ncbi:MAG TPA: hypothetical protein VI172_16990 [Candidatus Dormibacteraeota bacterium]
MTDVEGSYDNFSGKAVFKVLDGGVLEVRPNDEAREEKRIVYGPAGWMKVEVTTDRPVARARVARVS